MAEIIDGKLVSRLEREKIKSECERFKLETGVTPGLAVILVGNNPASEVYVKNKHKACLEVGFNSYEFRMSEDTTEDILIDKINELNQDQSIHGILVQLPLPNGIDEKHIISTIDPRKDVDAFHPENVGKIMIGSYDLLPCTPSGIMTLLDYYDVDLSGKRCVVVGRSNIVGKPISLLMLERHGTVTVCHSRTQNLEEITREADVLVVAVGKPEFIKGSAIKDGAVVIDVGINRLPNGRLVGDVEYESCERVASKITPVPGGVGPMTITTLLKNTLIAAKQLASRE